MKGLIFIFLFLLLFTGCQKGGEIKIISEGQPPVSEKTMPLPEKGKKETESISEVPVANPFLSLEEKEAMKSGGLQKGIDYLNITAIFYSPGSRMAVVDGKVVKEGDIIDNKKITAIQSEAIVLKDFEGEYILQLKDISLPSGKPEVKSTEESQPKT